MHLKKISILILMFIFCCFATYSQQSVATDEADSLHGLILKPEIQGLQRPTDMFQRNCADCHTEAIMYYTRYSQLWDTTFKSRDKYIHTWIKPVRNDTSADILLFAKGINVYNDTTPVKNAMVAVSVKENTKWIPIKSQILLTSDSGKAILKINEELNPTTRGRYEILVKLIDEVVYPNGKYRFRMNWGKESFGDLESHQISKTYTDNLKIPRSWLQFGIVFLVIIGVIIVFYFVYSRFFS